MSGVLIVQMFNIGGNETRTRLFQGFAIGILCLRMRGTNITFPHYGVQRIVERRFGSVKSNGAPLALWRLSSSKSSQ